MRISSLSVVSLLYMGLVGCQKQSQPLPSNLKAKQSISRAKSSLNIVGNYFEGGGYGGPGIELLANGQYVFSISSDTDPTKESGGDYTLTNGLLVLSPRYQINSTPGKAPEFHTVRTRVAMSGPDMRYLPVKWGNRWYLLEHGTDELRFCNAINLGDEPVPAKLTFMHPFMMRTGDEKKPVTGKPQLPAPWTAYILSHPVKGKVIRVHEGTATINVGSADNIHVGMSLIDNRQSNTHGITFIVTSVTAHQATFKVGEIPIHSGDTVSTHRTHSMWR